MLQWIPSNCALVSNEDADPLVFKGSLVKQHGNIQLMSLISVKKLVNLKISKISYKKKLTEDSDGKI